MGITPCLLFACGGCLFKAEGLRFLRSFQSFRHLLLRYRVFPHMAAYQDCYDAASDAYMFGIHRCAFCGYTGVGEYIRKLIPIAVKCALAVADEGRIICQENDLKRIYLDDPEKKKK